MPTKTLADFSEATTIDLATAAFWMAAGFTPNPGGTGTDKYVRPTTVLLALTGDNNVTAFTSLANAISTIGSTKARLLIPISTAVTANTTIPENITVVDTGSGDFNVSATKTLTINGPAEIMLRQFFTGAGNVIFGNRISYAIPHWFGAKVDAKQVTDGAMSTSGSANVLTSATAAFTSADVGKVIDVQGVGASAADTQGITSRHNVTGTITGFTNSTTVTVSFTTPINVTGKTVTWGTDDSSSVTKAAAAMSANAVLYFPRGKYVVNSSCTVVSGMTVKGDGEGVSILYWVGPTRNAGVQSKLFHIPTGVNKATIEDLSIIGTNAAAIGVTSASSLAYGIQIGTGSGNPIRDITIQNVEIAYTWGMGIRTDGDVGDQAGSDPTNYNFKFLDLNVHHNADNGLNPNTGGGLIISRCTLTDNGLGGLEFAGSRIQVSDCYIARNKSVGVALGGLGNPSLGKDNLLHHNLIERNGNAGSGAGVVVGGNVVHAIIDHNIIRENENIGISISDGLPDFSSLSRDIHVKDNIVCSNGNLALAPQAQGIVCNMNDVVIEGNDVFSEGGATYVQATGIQVSGDGVKLLRNRSRSNSSHDYVIVTATNVLLVRDNTTDELFQHEPNGYAGTVDTSGTTVTYKTGILFSSRWVGVPFKIDTTYYVVQSVAAVPTGGYTVSGTTVTRTSGTNFDTAWAGQYIKLGTTYYPIASVADASHLTITNPYGITPAASGTWELNGSVSLTLTTSAGTQSAKAYVIPPHVVYLPDNSVMQTVAFNGGTPIFDAQQGNVFKITLTGNVTASQLVNGVDGQVVTFFIFQDGTGSRTFVHSAAVLGATTIGSTASKNNVQSFRKHGSNWYAVAAGVNNQ